MAEIKRILLTCEHAGNEIPDEFQHLFRNNLQILSTHRAMDFGALEFAKRIAGILHSPLFHCTATRLLIDTNRSLRHPKVFSEFSSSLTDEDRAWLIRNIYRSYREPVERNIRTWIQSGASVLHLSVHSFTPVLEGRERNADIGLLYDPSRIEEKKLCRFLQSALKRYTGLRIRCNYPYLGRSDGFTTALRKTYTPPKYLGIELELNQSLLMNEGEKSIAVDEELCRSLFSFPGILSGISEEQPFR